MAIVLDSIINSNDILGDGAIDLIDSLPRDELINELKFVPAKPALNTSTEEDGPIGTTNPIKALLYPNELHWTTTFPGDDTTFITYSFMTGVDSNPNDNFDTVAMDANQIGQTVAALEAWEDVANIDFQFDPTGNGQIFFGTADLIKYYDDPNVTGLASGNPGDRVFVWLDNNYGSLDHPTNQNPTPGTDGFNTLLHEIGHALGLKHPGNYDPTTDEPPFLGEELDDNLYTVMSYYSDQLSSDPLTPMILDVAAIQYLYGASDRSGNNTYSWNAKSFAATIWDNGGIDSIFLSSADAFSSNIDLGQTNGGSGTPIEPSFGLPITRSSIFATGGVSHLVIPNGVVIEDVWGTSGRDMISGNAVANSFLGFDGNDELNGFAGNDYLDGGFGDDFLDGGVGDDILSGFTDNDIYIVDSPGDVVIEDNGGSDTGGIDKVRASISYTLGDRIEDLNLEGAAIDGTGNSLDNQIIGNAGNNVLNSVAGEDTLFGEDGHDTLIGENGNDRLTGGDGNDYLNGGNEAGTDISSVDSVFGDSGNDIVWGGNGNDRLNGGANDDFVGGWFGDDTLTGELGNDTLNGGAGIDTVKESENFGSFDLRDTFLRTYDSANQLIETDTLINIEGASLTGGSGNNSLYAYFFTKGSASLSGEGGNDVLNGGSGNDTLDGGSGNDVLSGHAGDDTLTGRSGSDYLRGGAGNDTLTGGDAANDIFVFQSTADFSATALGIDRIEDFSNGPDRIVLDKTVFSALKSNGGTGFTVFGFSVASEFAEVASDALAATSGAFITYSSATGNLFYNQNGATAGLGAGGQFAMLTNSPELTATDFCIVV